MECTHIIISTKVKIPKNDLKDLFVTAFEGGANHWYQNLSPLIETSKAGNASDRFYENIMKNGFTLGDKHAKEDKCIIVHTTSYGGALKNMAKKFPKHFTDFVQGNFDAETGDIFLQVLVYGNVIYG